MANFGPSKTWTDGEILSHTDLNAALLDIINNVTNNNIDADNIDETDDYTWSGANSFVGGHSIKVLSNAAASIVTGTTLEWDPGDGGQMTDNSSGISLDFKLPDAADNQDTFASIAAICLDDTSTSEDGELSFRVATAGTNTEQMTLSSTALTVTPAITASGGITGSVTSSNATITGGTITGITDIAIADGGTGASTAAAARTNLGLEIGVDVQAYDAELQALSGLTPTDGNIIVGNGSTFVTESGATARTSLGLGSIATQSASAVSITGGSLTGMTSYSGGTISGTTGTFSGNVTISKDAPQLIMTDSGVGGGTSDIIIDAIGSNHGFYFRADGATNHVILESNGDFKVDASVLFVDASADRVGINTSSPQAPLNAVSAYSSATTTTSLKLATVGGYDSGSGTSIDFGQDQSNYSTWLTGKIASPRTGTNWGGSLVFYTNDNSAATGIVERLRLNHDGNMGLGGAAVSNGTGSTVLNVNATTGGATIHLTNNTTGTTNSDGALFVQSGSDLLLINRESGNLKLRTADTDRLIIDSAGNAGLSVTPSTWRSTETALQVDRRAALYADSHVTTALANNLIINSGGYALIEADAASQYYQYQGAHVWQTVASGSAGANVSPTTVARMDSDGLKFGSDTAAANALSDYEQGTHNPSIGCSTSGSMGLNSSRNTLQYTKIGNWVNVQGYVEINSVSSGVGHVTLSMPFANQNDSEYSGVSMGSIIVSASSNPLNCDRYALYMQQGSSSVSIYATDGSTLQNDSAENITTAGGADLYLNISFRTQ